MVSFHGDQKGSFQSRVGSTVSRATGASGKRPDVEELEMLLEAYFVLVDGIIHHVASVMLKFLNLSHCSILTSEGKTLIGPSHKTFYVNAAIYVSYMCRLKSQ